jgi:hypothetical protein
VTAIEHVLSVSARFAGKRDFVSASIWRRTRTLSILGHGGDWIEALAELNLVSGNLGMPKAELSAGPMVRSQIVLQPLQEEKAAVWRLSGGANREAMDRTTTVRPSDPPPRPSASTVRAPMAPH